MEGLEKELGALGENVANIKTKAANAETKAETAEQLAKAAKLSAEEAAQAVANAIKEGEKINTSLKSIQDWQVKKDEADSANQEVINTFVASQKDGVKLKNDGNGVSLETLIVKALDNQKGELKAFSEKKQKELILDLKAVGDMDFSTNFSTANHSVNTVRNGMVELPKRKVHIRQLVPTGTMTGSSFTFLREVAGEGAPAAWASGTKAQFDLDWEEKTVNNEYIAGWLRMSRKLLDDVNGMGSYLNSRLPELLLKAEDAQLLNGNGTSPNISGITDAGNFVTAPDTATVAVERILDAIAFLEDTHERNATGILIRPAAYMDFFKNKAAGSGEYDLPKNVTYSNGILNIGGVPIFASTAATANQYIVGDWQQGAQLLVREAPSIVFAYEDGTNIRENKVTVRIEERIAFPIYGNNYFVVGELTTVV